jgi:hypothetical protein
LNDDALPDAGRGKVPVVFASDFKVALDTKVGGEKGDIWGEADTVGVYMVLDGGSLSQVVDGAANVPYRAFAGVGQGNSDLLPATADTIYYPLSGKVNFILYYPYSCGLNGDAYPVNLRNQSNQEPLDLMYVCHRAACDKTAGKVDIVFVHQLTKLVFRISGGEGIPPLSGMTLDLEGVALQTTFDLSDGILADPGRGGTDTVRTLVRAVGYDAMEAEAIVLPVNDLVATPITLRIRVGEKRYSALLPPTLNKWGIEGGNRYVYTVFLRKDGLTLSGELIPWTVVDAGDFGLANPDNPPAP